jgi:hypothetical protein
VRRWDGAIPAAQRVLPRELKNIAPPELMRRVTRADNYQQWTKDFLGGVSIFGATQSATRA